MSRTLLTKYVRDTARLLTISTGIASAFLLTSTATPIRADDKAPIQANKPTYADSYALGVKALSEGDYLQSRAEMERAAGLATNSKETVDAQVGVLRALIKLKEFDKAQLLLDKLQDTPVELVSDTTLQGYQAMILGGQGRTAEATSVLKKMLESSPQKPPGLKFTPDGKLAPMTVADLPQLLYSPIVGDITGKTPAQVQAALEEVAKDPNAPKSKREQAKIYVGDFLLNQGNSAQARDYYLDADVSSTSAWAKFSRFSKIADTYAAEQNWSKAMEFYDQALAVPGITPTPYEAALTKSKRDYASLHAGQK